jgi:hypothetical protein
MRSQRIINYHIHRSRDGIARVAFQVVPPLAGTFLRTEILREYPDGHRFRSRRDGLLPRADGEATLIAITHVCRKDLIIIRYHNDSGNLICEDRLRISDTFVPEAQYLEKIPLASAIVAIPPQGIRPGAEAIVHMHVNDLRQLYCDRHPKWLQSRLDVVLDSWEKEIPSFFVRVAPRARIARNLPLLIHHDPQRALFEFQRLLGAKQLQHCIRKEPFAAVQHAFPRIPRALRIGLVRKFSTYVLEHHLDRLTEQELKAASCGDAKTAFPLRHFVEGRRHAIMLANSYPASFFLVGHTSGLDFLAEVKDSVHEHPLVWRNSHHQSFAILFCALASTLGVVFTGRELLALSQKLGPALRQELRIFIGSGI